MPPVSFVRGPLPLGGLSVCRQIGGPVVGENNGYVRKNFSRALYSHYLGQDVKQ